MEREEALAMIEAYQTYARSDRDVLHGIRQRFPDDGSAGKAMRWLGFCQGVLHERGVFTLEELKEHSRTHQVTLRATNPQANWCLEYPAVTVRRDGQIIYAGPKAAMPDSVREFVLELEAIDLTKSVDAEKHVRDAQKVFQRQSGKPMADKKE